EPAVAHLRRQRRPEASDGVADQVTSVVGGDDDREAPRAGGVGADEGAALLASDAAEEDAAEYCNANATGRHEPEGLALEHGGRRRAAGGGDERREDGDVEEAGHGGDEPEGPGLARPTHVGIVAERQPAVQAVAQASRKENRDGVGGGHVDT